MIGLILAAALASGPALPVRSLGAEEDPVEALVRQLEVDRDAADPKLIADLAAIRTRAALDGLLAAYRRLGSIYMRREVLRALASFDGVADAEQPALETLRDVATGSDVPELRDAAIDGLGRAPHLGRHFLRVIVESPADDGVRIAAMEAHVGGATAADHAWYREICAPSRPKEKKGAQPREKDAEPEPLALRLDRVRRLAFAEVVTELDLSTVLDALGDRYFEIRGLALLELERRKAEQAIEQAERFFHKLDEKPPDARVVAAGILARAKGAKVADAFIDDGRELLTPGVLRGAMADLLAAMDDPGVEKKLLRHFGKGEDYEKLFFLRATRNLTSDAYRKKLLQHLEDKDAVVVVEACRLVAEHGERDAVPALLELLEEPDPDVQHGALAALAALQQGDPGWEKELGALASHANVSVRNLALRQLASTRNPEYLPRLVEALDHPQWSTRLAALHGLEGYRSSVVIPPILDRMEKEEGRMAEEFADALWRLTAKPFGRNTAQWRAWWSASGKGFEVLPAEKLAQVESEKEAWRLRDSYGGGEAEPPEHQRTSAPAKFFGIRIVSHRVLFIMDVSGSMNFRMQSRVAGQIGEPRLAVAKRELQASIDGLDPRALFGILVFSSSCQAWTEGVVPATPESREKAKAFIQHQGANGGTSVYDALKKGFADLDVDTIYLLSDGEPEGGTKDDPAEIRADVAQWNAERKVVIHTIAVGGQLQILRWLAEDSGGSHVEFQ